MSSKSSRQRVQREARLRWVKIIAIKVPAHAQRDLRQAHVDAIAAGFDPEMLGMPVLSYRDGVYYVLDGQHRIEALRLMGWGDQQIQCEVYEGLDEASEAEIFLKRNADLQVAAMDKHRVSVTAGREEDCDIDRIVRAAGLVVSNHKVDGAVRAIGTLRRIYRRGGPETLAKTLWVVRDAYGDGGLEAAVLDGVSLLIDRYNGDVDTDELVAKLNAQRGGVTALMQRAETLYRSTGTAKGQCVAAAAVEAYNKGRRGKCLPGWWKAAA